MAEQVLIRGSSSHGETATRASLVMKIQCCDKVIYVAAPGGAQSDGVDERTALLQVMAG